MIIVTSGHVDHGKTALLQALTGTNTAHLPEEKKRGMTIDLGYAYLPVGDKTLGFIDVPGHEKFLANMLAGLGGIHYAMLIVAADEGVSAQTKEHLAILRLLHLKQIIVVITKADRASSQQIEQLQRQIKQDYPFLADEPMFVTSAQTQQGIAELRDYLSQLSNLAEREKPFRYAIDRVFSVKGAGTVVTGTAFSGEVCLDQDLILANGQAVRVKNIHAQNTPSQHGYAGQRLALNLNVDLDRTPLGRGDWLFSDSNAMATDRITVELENEVELNETQPVHIYHAASHTTGKLSLLTAKKIPKNHRSLAEITLNQPLYLAFGDKLILRSGDAKSLVGGAKVLEINSPKRHKRSETRLQFLTELKQAQTPAERLRLYLQNQAMSAQHLQWVEQLTESQLTALLAEADCVRVQDWCFNASYQTKKIFQIRTALSEYHQAHNDQLGLGKARLYRIAALNQPETLIYHIIDQMLDNGELQQTRGWLHLPEHKIKFSADEQALWQDVLQQFNQAGGQALWVRDIATALAVDETAMRNFLYKAGKLGYLTAIVKDRFFLTENIYGFARLVKAIIAENGKVSVNELRDRLNFGRKLTVQLMEYFDRTGFLRRKGNEHILRDQDVFDL